MRLPLSVLLLPPSCGKVLPAGAELCQCMLLRWPSLSVAGYRSSLLVLPNAWYRPVLLVFPFFLVLLIHIHLEVEFDEFQSFFQLEVGAGAPGARS